MTVKPGSINMGRILRHMAQRTNQSRKVTFYRAPLYVTDDYGVEGGVEAESEIQLPGLPALIRPALTADYKRQRSGQNIIGAGRVYTANLSTIKGMPNFNQDNNENFNEIEGWDKFIDTSRTIFQAPTSVADNWYGKGMDATYTSDGQTLTATLGADYNGILYYEPGPTFNTLEADRITFKIKASGASNINLVNFKSCTTTITHPGYNDYSTTYAPATLYIPTGSWLTIDVPWTKDIVESGATAASGTSIYKEGTRYNVAVTAGDDFSYIDNLKNFSFSVSGAASGNTVMFKDIKFYKSLEWSVHSVKELNDDFNVFNVVRTAGRIDSRRRADAS
jgi:hypothetical protein